MFILLLGLFAECQTDLLECFPCDLDGSAEVYIYSIYLYMYTVVYVYIYIY